MGEKGGVGGVAAPPSGGVEMETSGEISPPPSPPPSEGNTTPPPSGPIIPSDLPEEDQRTNPLTDDLRDKIVRQVEYYFSDENLPTDKFLLKQMKKDKGGFVSITLIASFRKMKKLVQDLHLIEAALRTSTELVVSSDGKRVKRSKPLQFTEIIDAKPRTILVENLPEDYSTENIQKIFGNIGKINDITICDPHLAEESANNKKAERALSSKLHALIEYETVEAAERAVATLNDEKNWRTGMRVEILLKRMGKYGLFIPRELKEAFSEKKNNAQELSTDLTIDGQKSKAAYDNVGMANKGEEQHFSSEKGGRRGRHKGRGRGPLQQNLNRNGNDHVSSSSTEVVSKPLPGPRMPDGTRGFTMGRGKPIS